MPDSRDIAAYIAQRYMHRLRIIFVGISVVLSLAVVIIYLWHMLASPEVRWLPAEDLAGIRNFVITIVSGVTVSLGVTMMRNPRERRPKDDDGCRT